MSESLSAERPVAGPGFEWTLQLSTIDSVRVARNFAAKVNATASGLDNRSATPAGPEDLVAKLTKLRETGMLTDVEFAAAKARLLLGGEGGGDALA